jgi:hypothetical protein
MSDLPTFREQLSEVLSARATEQESPWLGDFEITTRAALEPLFVFHPDNTSLKDNCHYLHPNAIIAFQGGHIAQVEGLSFEDFARGAATIGSVLHSNDADRLADLIKLQLEVMHQRALSAENPYPNILDRLFSAYTRCVTLILLNEERTTWRPLLAYTVGFLWVLGLVTAQKREEGEVLDVLVGQVKRGTYY